MERPFVFNDKHYHKSGIRKYLIYNREKKMETKAGHTMSMPSRIRRKTQTCTAKLPLNYWRDSELRLARQASIHWINTMNFKFKTMRCQKTITSSERDFRGARIDRPTLLNTYKKTDRIQNINIKKKLITFAAVKGNDEYKRNNSRNQKN